jgi:hypothetical protein
MNMDGQDVQDNFLEEKKGGGAIREIAIGKYSGVRP